MSTTLEAIATEQQAAPIELPRLTVANTFTTFQNLGTALEGAGNAYKNIPDAGQSTTERIKDVIRFCEGAIKHANRLLEANR